MKKLQLSNLLPKKPYCPITDFGYIEKTLGMALPDDFKQILSTFGMGAFGELFLFHPNNTRESLRLPGGVLRTRELLLSVADQFNVPRLKKYAEKCLVLGELRSRTYLMFDTEDNVWLFYDTEMETVAIIGVGLCGFLMRAYQTMINNEDSSDEFALAQRIWDEPTPPFFISD